jgi:cysteine desulfurase
MPSLPIIYLDYAAATPVDPAVLRAMQPFFAENFYNPSAGYDRARKVRAVLNEARANVAHWIGARGNEVIFTAGGTEANNLAIHGVMGQYPDANVVISGIEHESVLEPARQYEHREVAVGQEGRLDMDDLRSKIDDKTALVSICYANNELGTVQSLREIAGIIAEKKRGRSDRPLYFHTDACQAGNYLDLHAARLGVDMMTLNGGKIYGPKQSGVLYVKTGVRLEPLIRGGGQERGMRSGTENIAAAVGFALALDRAQKTRRDETRRLLELRNEFADELLKVIPDAKINGSLKHRLPNNLHVSFPGHDNERLLIELEEAGILAAAGSACSAGDEEPSHVLKAIGLSDEIARASLRFTMGRATTEAMIAKTVRTLNGLI